MAKSQTTIRLEDSELSLAESLIPWVQKQPWATALGVEVTRALVLRAATIRGLELFAAQRDNEMLLRSPEDLSHASRQKLDNDSYIYQKSPPIDRSTLVDALPPPRGGADAARIFDQKDEGPDVLVLTMRYVESATPSWFLHGLQEAMDSLCGGGRITKTYTDFIVSRDRYWTLRRRVAKLAMGTGVQVSFETKGFRGAAQAAEPPPQPPRTPQQRDLVEVDLEAVAVDACVLSVIYGGPVTPGFNAAMADLVQKHAEYGGSVDSSRTTFYLQTRNAGELKAMVEEVVSKSKMIATIEIETLESDLSSESE